MRAAIPAALGLLLAASAAQPGVSPYAGQETREVKALSPDEVRALLTGEGMGLARAAELNRYPGPRHVLELAGPLALSETQVQATRAVYDRMRQEAVRLGAAIVEKERLLDRLFADEAIDERGLRSLVAEIAALQGELRAVHLAAHLEMKRLLSPDQVRRYAELRGYAGQAGERPQGDRGEEPHRH